MKKILTVLLTLMMSFSLLTVVRAEEDDEVDTQAETTESSEPTWTIEGNLKQGTTDTYTSSVSVTAEFSYEGTDNFRVKQVSGKIGDKQIYLYGGGTGAGVDGQQSSKIINFYNLCGVIGQTVEFELTIQDGDLSSNKTYTKSFKIELPESETAYFEIDGYKFGSGYGYNKAVSSYGILHNKTIKLLKDAIIDAGGYSWDLNGNTLDFFYLGEKTNVISSTGKGKIKFGDSGALDGSFANDVSKYLDDGYEIAKIDDYYKVFKTGETISVTTSTPAISNDVANDAKTVDTTNGLDTTNIAQVNPTLNTNASVDSEVKEKIETKAKEIASEGTIAKYFDLNLKAVDTKGKEGNITELTKATDVTVLLDDETNNAFKGTDVKVIRLHDGDVEEVDSKYDESKKTLTITSDKFSIFAIVTTKKATDNNTNNQTSGTVRSCEEVHGKGYVWMGDKLGCRYSVTNTSAR